LKSAAPIAGTFCSSAGMWFQDLSTMTSVAPRCASFPYGTQEGEISFCAYNTGIGWRNIIENMHQNATVAKWYQEHGRHEIFAGGKAVELDDPTHNLVLNTVDLARPHKPQMEGPKTAHEEAVMNAQALSGDGPQKAAGQPKNLTSR